VISSVRLQRASHVMHAGGVIAYPTEAVWGLGCDPFDRDASLRLLALKRRSAARGLILVAASEQQLEWLLTDLTDEQRRQLSSTWPGPTTWIIPHQGRVPSWVCGQHRGVAVRVSAHTVVRQLCQAFAGPVVSTSANPTGAQAATERYQVLRYFGSQLDDIVPGSVGRDLRPSTIRDLSTGAVVRA